MSPTRLSTATGAVLAALVPVFLQAALGPRYGGELKIGVPEMPVTTEPGAERGRAAGLLSVLIHETLVGMDEGGFPSPALAQGWSTAAVGREWTLRLREGAVFHDGRPVTAADTVRSLRRFLRFPSSAAARLADGLEGGAAFRAGRSEELPGLAAPDARRVVLRFPEGEALPLAPLAAPAAAVTGASGAGAGRSSPPLRPPDRGWPSPPSSATCAAAPTWTVWRSSRSPTLRRCRLKWPRAGSTSPWASPGSPASPRRYC